MIPSAHSPTPRRSCIDEVARLPQSATYVWACAFPHLLRGVPPRHHTDPISTAWWRVPKYPKVKYSRCVRRTLREHFGDFRGVSEFKVSYHSANISTSHILSKRPADTSKVCRQRFANSRENPQAVRRTSRDHVVDAKLSRSKILSERPANT